MDAQPETPPPPPAALPWRRKLLFSVLFAGMVLLFVEIVLRVFLGPPPPPVKVYNALGAHGEFFKKVGDYVQTTYVDQDPPQPFLQKPNAPRCAVLGGSSVHGGSRGLNAESEFPNLIARNTGIDVINLGSPGLDSFDSVQIVDQMVAWPWSCIVIYDGHNDFGNAYFQSRYGDTISGLGARTRAGLERFQIFVQLNRLLTPIEGQPRKHTRPGEEKELPMMDDNRWWSALRYFEANLRQIVWKADEHDIPVILVTPVSNLTQPPGQTTCDGDRCPEKVYQAAVAMSRTDPVKTAELLRQARDMDRQALRAPTEAQRAVARVADEEGAIFVDAENGLPNDGRIPVPASALFNDGVHFSAAGHVAMANVISQAVYEAVSGR